MKQFVGTHWRKGQPFGIIVPAEDAADAERKMQECGFFGVIDGEFVAEFPVNDLTLAPVGVLARIWCWVRNWGRQGMARGKVWRNAMRAQRQKDVADSQRALDELVARGLAVKGPDDRYRTPEAHEAVFGKPN